MFHSLVSQPGHQHPQVFLGAKVIGRRELENNGGYELKESQNPYNRVFDPEKRSLRLKNDPIRQVF